jgi:hypothetical protein
MGDIHPLAELKLRRLAALAVFAFLVRLLPGPRTVDDAFITFRYSRNLVEGNGFVYNIGDRVLGTTTPLYTLLMAFFGLFGESYPVYALVINALAGALEVVFLTLIAYHFLRNVAYAFWLGLLWSVATFSVTFAIGGMETSVHNACMLGAWLAYLYDRPRWLGATCALGFLTRPDALLWAAPLLLHQLWFMWQSGRGIPWQTWLTGLAITLPWIIFATAYFGSPIPQTVGAKAETYLIDSLQGLTAFIQDYATPFSEESLFRFIGAIIGFFVYPALALIGLRAASAQDRRALPIYLYPWIYAAVFIILNPLIFRWYRTPPLPAYFLAIVTGLHALLILVPRPRLAQGIFLGVATLTLLMSLSGWVLHPDHGPDRPAPDMAFHDIELNYERMAKRLRADYGVDEDTVLAAGDIGALGFYSRAHILDTIGLVTESSPPYYADQDYLESIRADEMNYVIPPDLILDAQPEFVVVMEGFIREGLARDPRFQEQYTLIEEIPTDYYGTGMLAFRRNSDEPLPPSEDTP